MEETNENCEKCETLKEEPKAEVKPEEPKKEEIDYKERYFYVLAEMDNMKKRYDREKESIVKFGAERIIRGFVEVVDNFDRTVDALKNEQDEKIKNIVTGIEMVRKQFLTNLTANGLETIESVGKDFDPNFHEAMAQQPMEGKRNQEVVVEYQKGYLLNGRLLRAAKVVVANNN